ncbi:hypothetical protein [Achromobacter insuavis]|uniref:hypothetical protein n=1 Tax=Achromobacter insuavis TaxID=1287735 RepID=UPI001F147867|nr:hypothetical protein [Achromobacter insuavis]
MKDYDQWIEYIVFQIKNSLDVSLKENAENFEQQITIIARRIAMDARFFGHANPPDEELLYRMRQLEDKYETMGTEIIAATTVLKNELRKELNRPVIACRMRDEELSSEFTQFIVSGGSSQTAVERGRAESDEYLSKWLQDGVEITILDPFLFKREAPRHQEAETDAEREAAEHRYADELLALVGRNKRINFIYRGNPDKGDGGPQKVTQGVANRIADRLAKSALQATFYVVEDLHDRVWMKLDQKGRWHANVVGTSRGGIGKRPTYIVPMDPEDCGQYLKFVHWLMACAQKSHERPINFKRSRRNNKKLLIGQIQGI